MMQAGAAGTANIETLPQMLWEPNVLKFSNSARMHVAEMNRRQRKVKFVTVQWNSREKKM